MKRNGYGYQPTSDPVDHKKRIEDSSIEIGDLTLWKARKICKEFSQNRTFFDHKDCPLYSVCGKSFGNEFVDLNKKIEVKEND